MLFNWRRCLETRLESLSTTFKQFPTPANRILLDLACTGLDLCLTEEVERTLRWARRKWYAKANKPNSMLSIRVRTFTPKYTPITLCTR